MVSRLWDPTGLCRLLQQPCIGGTSLAGGKGGILGTFVGGTFMGVISNAIVILAISPYWEKGITGIVILIAIAIDRIKAIKNQEV